VVGLAAISGAVNAATLQYQYSIDGLVLAGDEFGDPNFWNLTAGEVINASGVFTADLDVVGDVDVVFGVGDSMFIDLVGGSLSETDASGDITLTFNAGSLVAFDYIDVGGNFSSFLTAFDDNSLLFGDWDTNANLTVVPVPAAVWMFGSGLIALVGWARRRS
jgi:hypothetical protein